MARFVRAGVPIPKTIIAREEGYRDNREHILAALSFPLVFKLDGSQGNRVHKINSAEELDSAVAMKPKYERFLLQELVPNTFDTRTLVAYGTILGSIKRIGAPGSFLNNVSKGADVEKHELSETETALAIKACAATRIDFGGVDMIKTDTGYVVIEVNKSPQIAGFERVFGKDYVFSRIAAHLTGRPS
jgi:ribosomal protein S6--L-glutamate ligase